MSDENDAMHELFYRIADSGSAAARRFVVEKALVEQVRFRNLHYPEVTADFAARGGTRIPALWDGAALVEGEADVLASLAALAGG